MRDQTNAHKLHIDRNQLVWVVATSEEQGSLLDPLPEGAETVVEPIDGMDAAVVFVEDRAALATYMDEVLPQLGSTPVVWMAYPIGGRADIDRASIEVTVGEYGWQLVETVDLDDSWLAARLEQS